MKKIISVMIAICMMALAVPAMAESTDSGMDSLMGLAGALLGNGGEGTADESGELDALLTLAGSVLGDADENGESATMSALLGMLSAFGGTDASAEPAYTAVPADSIEQFYGTWAFSRASTGSVEMSLDMLAALGMEASAQMTLSADKIIASGSFGETAKDVEIDISEGSDSDISLALVEGGLDVTVKGETVTFNLTDAGELACSVEGISVFFAPVEE